MYARTHAQRALLGRVAGHLVLFARQVHWLELFELDAEHAAMAMRLARRFGYTDEVPPEMLLRFEQQFGLSGTDMHCALDASARWGCQLTRSEVVKGLHRPWPG